MHLILEDVSLEGMEVASNSPGAAKASRSRGYPAGANSGGSESASQARFPDRRADDAQRAKSGKKTRTALRG